MLIEHGVAYLAGEVRTGKTLTVINTINEYFPFPKSCKVLWITSKKAKRDVQAQYKASGHKFKKLIIENYESIHKVKDHFDFLVIDEAHRLGAFPKPGKTARIIKQRFSGLPTVLMSGTPSPESYSQLYHQFWVTGQGPWTEYKAFYGVPKKYSWSKNYVKIKKVPVSMGLMVNNYKDTKKAVLDEFKPYCVTMTQQDAGFKGKVIEHFHTVKMPDKLLMLLSILKEGGINRKPYLMADSAAKMSSYFHQISSGTVIDQDGKGHILDDYKVRYLRKHFEPEGLVIFYQFIKEGELIKKYYPNWTSDPEVFRVTNKPFVCQVSSGREGINLSTAKDIVFFNIAYSALSYWQARSRSQSKDGGDTHVHWLFSDKGVESSIYEAVVQKKNYTLKHFEQYVRNISSKKNQSLASKERMEGSSSSGDTAFRLARPYGTKKRRSLVHRSKTTRRTTKRNSKGKHKTFA